MADETDPTIHCGNCGRLLDEPAGVPIEKRTPCPDCHEVGIVRRGTERAANFGVA